MLGALAVMILCAVASAVACAVTVRRDPRRLGTGALLLGALVAALAALLVGFVPALGPVPALVLSTALWGLLGVLVAGLAMCWTGLRAGRPETPTRPTLLTGLGGLALLAAPPLALALARTGWAWSLVVAAPLLGIAVHAGLTGAVLLGAALLHGGGRRGWGRRGEHPDTSGVIVLGSALVCGELSPLLRARLDLAAAERERLRGRGVDALLVPSGARGPGEPRAEGTAMAEYLVEVAGVPASAVRAETRALTTEQNLHLSRPLLAAAGHAPPYTVCTSDYHAFRAGLLMRRLGVDDTVLGAPTPLADLPAAALREALILLSYRRWWCLAAAPLTAAIVLALPWAVAALG